MTETYDPVTFANNCGSQMSSRIQHEEVNAR